MVNYNTYDKVIIAFSGGKDCTAAFLHMLECGVPREKIELWHHDVDGRGETFMDWECTASYCRAFAAAFGVPIYFSWKEGGFKREMLRKDQLTAPTCFEDENHVVHTVGGTRGKLSTRMKFPQVSPDLSVRWCSSYLKIDICATAIRHQKRFNDGLTVIVSGERGEESPARAKYSMHEIDRSDNRLGRKHQRFVDRLRPVRDWTEKQVWEIIERWLVRVHPAYYLGYGRVSCKYCIFGNANQMATSYFLSPKEGDEIMGFETQFGCTIKRDKTMLQLVSGGTPYEATIDAFHGHDAFLAGLDEIAISADEYPLDIFMKEWVLPAGAYGENCGPQ